MKALCFFIPSAPPEFIERAQDAVIDAVEAHKEKNWEAYAAAKKTFFALQSERPRYSAALAGFAMAFAEEQGLPSF